MKKAVIALSLFFLIIPNYMLAIDSIAEKTKDLVKHEGFFNFYTNNSSDQLLVEVFELGKEFLFINSLSRGMGSNDIGFDRGKLGRERVVYFKRFGSKIMLIQPNYNYRAVTSDASESKAVRESFARSVLWGFPIVSESGERVLIDLTPFLLSDDQNLTRALKNNNQGNFTINESRSAINFERTKNFPENSEFDALLTLTGNDPGKHVRNVVPTAESITLNQHFSFVKLPDTSYDKRIFDPRAGLYGISYQDYATPIDQPLIKQFIVRHRLEKKYPDKPVSPAKKPIIYYVDNGTPEPIRSALIEGASWWNKAFEAIGYKDAFQVKVLPQSADPMDIRYNVIQWVHRSTRGWSYGNSVIDPRSGEILKGHVSLGSLRVRQDFLIASGLLAPYKNGETIPEDMQKMALARLRQLSAHEVGHTLGLMHNFAASYNNRASVMDYPHPLIKINQDNTFDLSNAYDTGIGEWDKVAIAYAYSVYKNQSKEKAGLKKIVNEYIKEGLKYITDADARPVSGAHPFAHLWENGTNPAEELNHILKVRRIALKNFSENVIRNGEPFAELEDALVPIYLMHRYAVESASKVVGGLDYSYAVRGDEQLVQSFIDPNIQRRALKSLLKTVLPENLQVAESLLNMLTPRPPGYPRDRENFASNTGVIFDPLAAANSAIHITFRMLLDTGRLARIHQYHAREVSNPSLKEVMGAVFNSIFEIKQTTGYSGDLQRLVQATLLDYLVGLYADPKTTSYVKSEIYYQLLKIEDWLDNNASDEAWEKHNSYLTSVIKSYLRNPKGYDKQPPVYIPPGSPIGSYPFINADCGL